MGIYTKPWVICLGKQDGSAGKGVAVQAWVPEFNTELPKFKPEHHSSGAQLDELK